MGAATVLSAGTIVMCTPLHMHVHFKHVRMHGPVSCLTHSFHASLARMRPWLATIVSRSSRKLWPPDYLAHAHAGVIPHAHQDPSCIVHLLCFLHLPPDSAISLVSSLRPCRLRLCSSRHASPCMEAAAGSLQRACAGMPCMRRMQRAGAAGNGAAGRQAETQVHRLQIRPCPCTAKSGIWSLFTVCLLRTPVFSSRCLFTIGRSTPFCLPACWPGPSPAHNCGTGTAAPA